LTALTLAGVYSMSRLFLGGSFVGPVLGVALGAHAVAWLCRNRSWPPVAATGVCLVALILLVSWFVLPGSTSYGIPWLHTWQVAVRSFHEATTDFHRVTAPAPATQGFVLVAAAGVGILAVLADWAAFRMRATLEATVPSFALFIFCAAIGSSSGRTEAVVVEVAALILFVIVHQAILDQETSAWFANRTEGALKSVVTAGAVLGLAALVVALNLGLRLPGATSRSLIAWRATQGGAGTRSTESPLVTLQGRLINPSPNPVFTVVSTQPEYWRQTALDAFDGTNWNALSTYHSVGTRLSGGSTPTVAGTTLAQRFDITNLDSPWLPAAYRPVAVSGIKGVTWDAQSGSLISQNNSLTGSVYNVTSLVSAGSNEVSRLEAAPPPDDNAEGQYLQLPSIDARVKALAEQIVAGKASEYDKALAIQDYLRNPALFSYNERYTYDGPDPLGHFLFDARQGYCQQFAGSYAVLARIVGVPTRLAVGWTWGSLVGTDTYQVTDQQAHTWPEVYFTGVGWVPFEPTPGRGIPGAQDYTSEPPAQSGGSPAATTTPTTATTSPSTPAASGHHVASSPTTTPPKTAKGSHHRPAWLSLLIWLGGVVAGCALLLACALALRWLQGVAARDRVVNHAAQLEAEGAPDTQDRFARFRREWSSNGSGAAKTLLRRLKAIASLGWLLPVVPGLSGKRRRPAPRPEVVTRAEVLLTWSEAVDLLAWWGIRRRPSETYRELAHRAGIELRGPLSVERDAVHALLELADAGTKAEFGYGQVSDLEVEVAAADLATLKGALLTSASAAQRLRLRVDPRLSVKVR
jgi:transglutaminase-like putative cysteine protease